MSAENYGFAVGLANTMGWGMDISDFGFSQFLEPEGCFVLCEGSTPVGLATCVGFGKLGWFGDFVVEKESRGRGGGGVLLGHAIDYLRSMGVESVGLYAYPHLEDFYGRFGFRVGSGLKVLCNDLLQANSLFVGGFESGVDFSLLSDFDCEFFGADRSRLLEGILQKRGNLCFVARENGVVVGYVLAKVQKGVVEVGPLVCRPDRFMVVLDLLKVMLCRLVGRRVVLYLLDGQNVFEEFLLGVGFRIDFSLLGMFLGKSVFNSGVYLAESLERG
ncbi:MAG: GNAT family N-acetyltransferase [Nitrososphaerota archaeon]|nr:GNAT family N-acetyltransferase [Nitrososphaerota archaeon]